MSPARATVPEVRFGQDGLIPAIVQDRSDGAVLMLGWMDAEALDATVASGEVHFHSRSRGRLWRKGETSGHTLHLVDVRADCDRDALLVTADPAGPTCHRGTRSCFDPSTRPSEDSRAGAAVKGFGWLERLWQTIEARREDRPPGSYTAELLAGGVDATARKVVEEATEVVLAAKDDAAADASGADRTASQAALAAEAADLLYHTLVLLAERRVEPEAVVAILRDRHRRSATPPA